jgi:hypothetical protein
VETVARTPRPTFFLMLSLFFFPFFLLPWIGFPRNIYSTLSPFSSPSHFASQDTANHVLDGIYLIDRLIRALSHTHFADMYDIMDYLLPVVWVIMPFHPPSSSSELRSRDESSPELSDASLPGPIELILRLVFIHGL